MALPINGDSSANSSVATVPVALPVPIVPEADLLDEDNPINDVAKSGKGPGGFVALKEDVDQTSGALVVGEKYTTITFVAGDVFTNVADIGALANVTGAVWTAIGTTATTYSNGSTLRRFIYKLVSASNSAQLAPWRNVEAGGIEAQPA